MGVVLLVKLCHAKIRYFGIHVPVKENIGSFYVSMNNFECGLLVQES